MATTITTGMLAPDQAATLVAASKGTALFEPVADNSTSPQFQSSLLCGYLLDMLAGKQILWNLAYAGDDIGTILDSLCIVLVVNQLSIPLQKSSQEVYAGWPWAQPAGTLMDGNTGNQSPSGEVVPPADKDGNAGLGVWAFASAENRGAINFGLSFQADPSAWPDAMSLGVLFWNETLHAINLIATDNPAQAMDNAWNDKGNNGAGTRQCTVFTSHVIAGRNVAVSLNASLQFPDPTNFGLVIVSVSPS